jgi:hypothetical protein
VSGRVEGRAGGLEIQGSEDGSADLLTHFVKDSKAELMQKNPNTSLPT